MLEMPLGWLSPDGDLWRCKYYEHTATAQEICKKLNIAYSDYTFLAEDEALYAHGWCKLAISSLGNKQYWVHWERPLTEYQRYFLKDYFENVETLKFPMDSTSLCRWLYEDEFLTRK